MSVKKVEIYSSLVPGLQQLVDQHPGQVSNTTAAVNAIIELYLPAYQKLLSQRATIASSTSVLPHS